MTFSVPVWVCPMCRFAVSWKEYKLIAFDPQCSKCQGHRWSEFVYVEADADIREALMKRKAVQK